MNRIGFYLALNEVLKRFSLEITEVYSAFGLEVHKSGWMMRMGWNIKVKPR